MISCYRCEQEKSDDDFAWKNKRKGQRHTLCKQCKREYNCKWYAENKETHKQAVRKAEKRQIEKLREWVFAYLMEHPCCDCGESDPVVLDFDHVRGKKRYNVSDMHRTQWYSLDTLKREIEKCVVRCANCHRRRTAQAVKSFKWRMSRSSSG